MSAPRSKPLSAASSALMLLRVLGIAIVLNYHMAKLHIPGLSAIQVGGRLGNEVFFFVSGFGLTLSARATPNWDWVRRRWARVFPPCYVSLIPTIAILLLLGRVGLAGLAKAWPYLLGIQFFVGQDYLGAHLWFVSVILLCYGLFFPTRYLIERFGWRFLAVAVISLLLLYGLKFEAPGPCWVGAVGLDTDRISQEPLLRCFSYYAVFTLGIWWGHLSRHMAAEVGGESAGLWPWLATAIGLLLAFAALTVLRRRSPYLSAALILVSYPLLVSLHSAAVAVGGRLATVPRWLALFSEMSYPIYLTHYAVIDLAAARVPLVLRIPFVLVVTVLLALAIIYAVRLLSNCVAGRSPHGGHLRAAGEGSGA